MIGQKTTPFARYVLNGLYCREDVRQTIAVFISRGIDVNALDSCGQTPLVCATMNLDIEQYIVEELLAMGASALAFQRPKNGNIASLIAPSCMDRHNTTWKIKFLLS